MVHNGIIENYLALRQELEAAGHRFRSQTDTEVIPHLIEQELKDGAPLARSHPAGAAQRPAAPTRSASWTTTTRTRSTPRATAAR